MKACRAVQRLIPLHESKLLLFCLQFPWNIVIHEYLWGRMESCLVSLEMLSLTIHPVKQLFTWCFTSIELKNLCQIQQSYKILFIFIFYNSTGYSAYLLWNPTYFFQILMNVSIYTVGNQDMEKSIS